MGYLDQEQHAIVTEAVSSAELTTSGEIVTVLADRSDGYTDVALWWAIGFAFTAMSVVAALPDFFLGKIDMLRGGWSSDWTQGQFVTLVLLVGLAKFLGVLTIQLWQPLKFKLVPSPVKGQRVREAAIRHFKVGAERRTHGRTGVLLYLSMREHRAEIVADEAIATHVPAEIWGEAMVDMLAEVSRGQIAEGLAAGVRDVGKVLAEHFPREDDDQNELPDRLIEV
ncbi:MAG: TPM domain-containing protein [Qipengyuania vulgaris]